MPARVLEPLPHPSGKVLDRVQEHQNLQVNNFVGMLDNQQNVMIDINYMM